MGRREGGEEREEGDRPTLMSVSRKESSKGLGDPREGEGARGTPGKRECFEKETWGSQGRGKGYERF